MTLASTLARIPYTAVGGETSIPIPFQVQRPEDLEIWLTPSGGSPTLLVYGTHYNVTGLFNATATATLVTAATAGDLYLVLRIVAITQDLSLRQQGHYEPRATERELDRIVMMIQQLDMLLSTEDPSNARALLLGVNDVIGSGAYDALSNRIKNMDDPTADQDSATKHYVDAAVAGVTGGGGSGFVFATVTAAGLPTAGAGFLNKVYYVKDIGLPGIWKVCGQTSSGGYDWATIAMLTT